MGDLSLPRHVLMHANPGPSRYVTVQLLQLPKQLMRCPLFRVGGTLLFGGLCYHNEQSATRQQNTLYNGHQQHLSLGAVSTHVCHTLTGKALVTIHAT